MSLHPLSSNKNIFDNEIKFNDSFNINSKYNIENYENIDDNLVHKTAIINWDRIKIGKGNTVGPYACIGTEPPNISQVSDGIIEIGNGNNICEYVTIHLPTINEIGTVIGNNNILMSSAHIGHDCVLENDIVLCNNVAVAGHVRIMSGANLALNSSVHQFKVVGSWAMVGMNTCLNKSITVEPGNIYFGIPAKNMGKNILGLRRKEISKNDLSHEIERFYSIINNSNCS